MSTPFVVRPATRADAAACVELYAPYVEQTVITFETEVPSVEQFAQRIADFGTSHAWLVGERDGAVVGYAYAHGFGTRAAYRWSCETSIYVGMTSRGEGVGRALYGALLPLLAARGFRRAFAGVTQPNDASNAIHRSFGFEPAGLYRRVGWKHGAWHDVAWSQLDLLGAGADPGLPPEPLSRAWTG